MVVGDDAQSIYSFRGANYQNIFDFPSIFPNTKIIKLEQNYRSTQNILDLTNKIIEKTNQKYSKTLFSEIISPVKPALICAKDSQMEADFVAHKVVLQVAAVGHVGLIDCLQIIQYLLVGKAEQWSYHVAIPGSNTGQSVDTRSTDQVDEHRCQTVVTVMGYCHSL